MKNPIKSFWSFEVLQKLVLESLRFIPFWYHLPFQGDYFKNPSIVKMQLLMFLSCEQQKRKKITKNQDKYAENYSADADLSVLMGNFIEDTLYTVVAYSFSFVLLLAVTSEFSQFHLTDFHFQLLQLS